MNQEPDSCCAIKITLHYVLHSLIYFGYLYICAWSEPFANSDFKVNKQKQKANEKKTHPTESI